MENDPFTAKALTKGLGRKIVKAVAITAAASAVIVVVLNKKAEREDAK